MPRAPIRVVPIVVVLSLAVGVAAPARAEPAEPPPPDARFTRPVEGRLVDPFRPPAGPYAPGNRGHEYRTVPGAEVVASGAGRIVWAGPVGGDLHVTVMHAEGIRTSYSFLSDVRVRLGQAVRQGQVLGRSGGRIHFGVRVGDEYVDPASLFARVAPSVRLVPLELPADLGRLAIEEQRGFLGLGLDLSWASPGDLLGAGWSLVEQHIDPLAHYAVELLPSVRQARVARRWADRWGGACTADDVRVRAPSQRRIAVLVGGLGTTSERSSIDALDTDALGYAADDVVRFSYAGGRTPSTPAGDGSRLSNLPAAPYDEHDSQQDLVATAGRLAELLQRIAEEEPGVPVDVMAHSQGGVVVQTALARPAALPEQLDLVVTMGSPHDGADIATGVAALRATPRGRTILHVLRERLDVPLEPDSASVRQLAETSELMEVLGRVAPPDSVRMLTIGARGDLTVPAGHTRLEGADHHVVDVAGSNAHSLVTESPETVRQIQLALSGRPPSCESALDVLADVGQSEAISWLEDGMGALATVATRG